MSVQIISVDQSNVDTRGMFCVKNKKHVGYQKKSEWLNTQFEHGLRLSTTVDSDSNSPSAFLEYTPAESAFRPVIAPNYLFIHCIWSQGEKFNQKGTAKKLIKNLIQQAQKERKDGVCVVTSDDSWMSNRQVFAQCGFKIVQEYKPFQLMSFEINPGSVTPHFPKDLAPRSEQYQDLTLLYSAQCPFVGKAINELPQVAKQFGQRLTLIEVTTGQDAQAKFASPYGVFNLFYKGQLLAEHPISATRFKNILTKNLTS